MNNNNPFEQLENEIRELGPALKIEIEKTRKNLQTSELPESSKKILLEDLTGIESSLTEPDKGISKLLETIKNLNDNLSGI